MSWDGGGWGVFGVNNRGEIYLHGGGAVGLTPSEEEVVLVRPEALLRVSILFPLHLIIITILSLQHKYSRKKLPYSSCLPDPLSPFPSLKRVVNNNKEIVQKLRYQWFLGCRALDAEMREKFMVAG